MDRTRLLVGTVVLTLALIPGCTKKSSPAQPAGGPSAPVESFNSGVFSNSSSIRVFVHTFSNAGTFGYRCTVHGASMSGGVEVGPAHPESNFVSITDNTFTPSLVTVRPGGYIKWIANGGNHGVRSN